MVAPKNIFFEKLFDEAEVQKHLRVSELGGIKCPTLSMLKVNEELNRKYEV